MKRVFSQLPQETALALKLLHEAGHEAVLVGGCVRHACMGIPPHDWDIATSALPQETARMFSAWPLQRNGEKHGTVTVLFSGGPVEITTFRVDGIYKDHRRPSQVQFSQSLQQDLQRRDFTINAMAWDGASLLDPYGGQEDLRRKRICCVGDPSVRFEEDGLRILRALRFASVLSFSIEEETAQALLSQRNLLHSIAAERISQEFLKLLCGRGAVSVLRDYRPVFEVFLPEIRPTAGLDQRSPYHCYDVWEHTLHALACIPAEPDLRLAALLHDIGKPLCCRIDETGRGHFPGHQELGASVAERVCRRLRLSRQMTAEITTLVRCHDLSVVSGEANVKRWLRRLGSVELYRKLLELNRADTFAHAAPAFRRLPILDEAEQNLAHILNTGQCWSLHQLAVSGKDLRSFAHGPALGRLMNRLLDSVIDGSCPNERDPLLALAARLAVGTDAPAESSGGNPCP